MSVDIIKSYSSDKYDCSSLKNELHAYFKRVYICNVFQEGDININRYHLKNKSDAKVRVRIHEKKSDENLLGVDITILDEPPKEEGRRMMYYEPHFYAINIDIERISSQYLKQKELV